MERVSPYSQAWAPRERIIILLLWVNQNCQLNAAGLFNGGKLSQHKLHMFWEAEEYCSENLFDIPWPRLGITAIIEFDESPLDSLRFRAFESVPCHAKHLHAYCFQSGQCVKTMNCQLRKDFALLRFWESCPGKLDLLGITEHQWKHFVSLCFDNNITVIIEETTIIMFPSREYRNLSESLQECFWTKPCWENPEDILKTLQLSKQEAPDSVETSRCNCCPPTQLRLVPQSWLPARGHPGNVSKIYIAKELAHWHDEHVNCHICTLWNAPLSRYNVQAWIEEVPVEEIQH